MKKYILIFFILLSASTLYSQKSFWGKAIGIKDGDTVVVIDSLNNQTTLRLAEVDCPEKAQAFGTKAKQFTSDKIYLKQVKYIVTDIDRYGRSIAKIYYDNNKYLSEEIIRNGFGWQYKKYSTSKLLARLEEEARKNKRGLWIDPNPIYPSDWRRK
jgi:endonuclease YncB( thermonuclease family)